MTTHETWCRSQTGQMITKSWPCDCGAEKNKGLPIHYAPGDSVAAQVELKRHPFQGPDQFGNKTLKIWGHNADSLAHQENEKWAPFRITPWKPIKTSKLSAHVEMSQRVFWTSSRTRSAGNIGGGIFEFTFWALAPAVHGVRWGSQVGTTEFVWLILDGTNGRGVHHALVDKETDEVYWFEKTAAHYQEIAS